MSAPKTEENLAKSRWWWRRTRFLFPRNSFDPNWHERREWEDGLEQTAFEYELVLRVCKTRQLLPFVELDSGIQSHLRHQLCPPRKKSTRKITTESNPRGWSEPNAEDWRFNLEATDNQLLESLRIKKLPTEAELTDYLTGKMDEKQFDQILAAKKAALPSKSKFLAEINRQREAQGITPPRGLQGQRNRSVSWRWVELLDIAAFKIKQKFKDTDSERQTKRRARTLARKLLPKYLQTLEEFENAPWRPKEKSRPIPLLAREG